MKFFQPIIQLAREPMLDEPDAYFLHVVTLCPHTSFRANGHEVDSGELSNGKYIVRVKLLQDPNLPDYPYITPVVHTLALGSIDFPGGEGVVEVTVVGDVLAMASPGTRDADPPKTGGTSSTGTTGSDTPTKPIDGNSLYSIF